ncbi:hypothetical protein IFM89_029430, partial [Coptis chinensis]
NEYRIIRLIRLEACVISVFTFKVGIWAQENVNLKRIEGTWRNVEKRLVSGFEETYYVLVNGVTHWLGSESKGVTVCFDLKDERFYEMQMSDLDVNYVCHPGEVRVSLGDLGGLLSLFFMLQAKEVDIWVMGEYGLAKSGEIIIRKDYGQLLLYDLKQNFDSENVPPKYSTTLSSLRDKAVPCDFKAIKEVIVRNLGQELSDIVGDPCVFEEGPKEQALKAAKAVKSGVSTLKKKAKKIRTSVTFHRLKTLKKARP